MVQKIILGNDIYFIQFRKRENYSYFWNNFSVKSYKCIQFSIFNIYHPSSPSSKLMNLFTMVCHCLAGNLYVHLRLMISMCIFIYKISNICFWTYGESQRREAIQENRKTDNLQTFPELVQKQLNLI